MEGIELKLGMTEDELESKIRHIFVWYMENKCPYIKENYMLGKNRIHLYTYMKPVILAKLFNITVYPNYLNDYTDWKMIFQPELIKNVYIDDCLDDIIPTSKIIEIFIRWHINSIIAHYLDQSILDNIPSYCQDDFFKLLKKEIRTVYHIGSSVIDHRYESKEIGNKLKNIFTLADDTVGKLLINQ